MFFQHQNLRGLQAYSNKTRDLSPWLLSIFVFNFIPPYASLRLDHFLSSYINDHFIQTFKSKLSLLFFMKLVLLNVSYVPSLLNIYFSPFPCKRVEISS